MIEWYKKVVFDNYANFKGRARRSEYWYYSLISLFISIILAIFDYVLGATILNGDLGILRGLYSLIVLIPGLAVTVRRLHDVGKSGWFFFIILIPLIGAIWLLILFFTEGEDETNAYGPSTNDIFDEISEIGKE